MNNLCVPMFAVVFTLSAAAIRGGVVDEQAFCEGCDRFIVSWLADVCLAWHKHDTSAGPVKTSNNNTVTTSERFKLRHLE